MMFYYYSEYEGSIIAGRDDEERDTHIILSDDLQRRM